ncbi:aldo/keto reductase [Halocatena salina]|uniref:Aldo/keto reductase n=1 Tax=Halocatena salina TaxID=2934340 RepID=A0A8U0A173_9EURY|nr:aldo/keto reductase [Halocatena salina]UPM41813.1 aldo/keto reductase [Halocatena salina]
MADTTPTTFDIGGELTVNRLGFGAMRLTGEAIIGPPTDENAAKAVLRRAIDLGIDLIDTADSYGPGVSERLIRETLHPFPEELVIATKGGLLRNRDGDWRPCGDPDYLRNAVLCSRDRLGVETIDLYQYHRPDPEVPFEDSITALAELRDDGVIDHLGLSNVTVEQIDRARDITEIATVQNKYNVTTRDDEDVLEACEEADIGFIPWAPMDAGSIGENADALRTVADEHDATPQQIALAWLLHHSPVILPIPGTASVDHLEENVAAAEIDLTDAQLRQLRE